MIRSLFNRNSVDGIGGRLRRDERGQSVWIGFVLLLALLLLVLAGYQTYSVPVQNSETEFEHNQEVQGDMEELSNSLVSVRGTGEGTMVSEHRPVRLRLGTSYRTRALTINPPPPTGSLNVRDRGPVSISGATTQGAFQGTPQETLLDTDHDTRLLVYQPQYNEYDAAPTTRFEHSLLYNQFGTANRTIRGQRTVRGGSNRLNIVLFEGEVSESGRRTTLDPETLDGPTAPVPVEPTSGNTFVLTLPTDAPQLWASPEVIGETYDDGEQDARVTATEPNSVTIELRGQWDLQMTRVGFDGGQANNEFSTIEPVEQPAGTGNQTYRVHWDRDAMDDTQGVEYDPATDTVLIDDTVDTIQAPVFVRERATGDPIEGATVDPGTTDSGVISVGDDSELTDANGRTIVTVTPGVEGMTRLFAASGDDVDSLDASVVAGEDKGSAGAVTYQSGSLSLPANGQGIRFETTINGPVTVTSAAVDTRTMPGGVRTGLNIFRIDGTDRAPGSYNSDGSTIPLDRTTINGVTSFHPRNFQAAGNSLPSNPDDYSFTATEPSGAYVAVRVDFDDGTSTTFYFAYRG